MNNKRLGAFLAVLAVLVSASFGAAHVLGWSNDTACPQGEEIVRDFTTNKIRKFTCKKVEELTDVEN